MEHFSTSLVSFIWPAFFTFLYFILCDKETSCTRLLAHDQQAEASKIKTIHPDRRLTVRHLRQILMKETRNR